MGLGHKVNGALCTGYGIRDLSSHIDKIYKNKFHSDNNFHAYLTCVMRKPAFCIYKSNGADQLHSYCAADQRLCFFAT